MSATDVANPGAAIEDIEHALDEKSHRESTKQDLAETRRKMERTASRGLGRMQLTVNYPRESKDSESVPFARLSIDQADQILDRIDELQSDDDATRHDMREFVVGTLEEYCLDPEKNADHWASELTYGDGVALVRQVAFGGNAPET